MKVGEKKEEKKKWETCFNLQLLPADLSWYLPGHSLGRVWSQHQVSSRQARVGGRKRSRADTRRVKLAFLSALQKNKSNDRLFKHVHKTKLCPIVHSTK